MANLMWIRGGDVINDMVDEPIHPESEIEKLVYNTKGILQDIILIQKGSKAIQETKFQT